MAFSAFHEEWLPLFSADTVKLVLPPAGRSQFLEKLAELKDLLSFTEQGGFIREMPDAASSAAAVQYLLLLTASCGARARTITAAVLALEHQLQLLHVTDSSGSPCQQLSVELVTAVAINLGIKSCYLKTIPESRLSHFVKSVTHGSEISLPKETSRPFFRIEKVIHCLWLVLRPPPACCRPEAESYGGTWAPEVLDAVWHVLVAVLADGACGERLLHQLATPCVSRLLSCYSDIDWIDNEKVLDLVEQLAELPERVWLSVLQPLPRRNRGLLLRRLCAYFLLQKLQSVSVIDLPVYVTISDIVERVRAAAQSGAISCLSAPPDAAGEAGEQLRKLLLFLQLVDMAVYCDTACASENRWLLELTDIFDGFAHIRDTLDAFSDLRSQIKSHVLCCTTKWRLAAGVDGLQLSYDSVAALHPVP